MKEETPQSNAHRTVPARDLCRCAAALLDEVERDGKTILIHRYGYPAAMLCPVAPELGTGRIRPRRAGYGTLSQEEDLDVPDVVLDDLQRELLLRMSRKESREVPGAPGEQLGVALGWLEIEGLLEREWGILVPTPIGRRLIRAFEKQEEGATA